MLVKVQTAHGDLYVNPSQIVSLLVYPTRLSKLALAGSDATWSLDAAETARLLASLLPERRDEFATASPGTAWVAFGSAYGRRDLTEYTADDAMRDELCPPHLVQQAAELGEVVADLAERLKRLLIEIEAAKRSKEGT